MLTRAAHVAGPARGAVLRPTRAFSTVIHDEVNKFNTVATYVYLVSQRKRRGCCN